MRPAFYNDSAYKQKQSSIIKRLWQDGRYNLLKKPLEVRLCQNPGCQITFKVKPSLQKRFCSHNCSAIVNNLARKRSASKRCLTCGQPTQRSSYKYCSNKCQAAYNYQQYIQRWKQGLEDGNRGKSTKLISKYLKRYLLEKYGSKCSSCGWNEKHLITGIPPLEVDHVDGNANNNHEENLRILCPNCHALTPNFRNLNKGKGRSWRLIYLKTNSLI